MRFFYIFIFGFFSFSVNAKADCPVVPTGSRATGVVIYNVDYEALQACQADGTWQAISPIGCPVGDGCNPDPCTGSPSPGQVCADGSVYAGLSPDGNVPMFTTPADAGQFNWNDGSTNWLDTAMENCVSVTPGAQASCQTGEANTALLVGLGMTPSPAPYGAARHCNALTAHGHDDWYLPAQDELAVLYANHVALGGFNVSGSYPVGYYWSSSENDFAYVQVQNFSDGGQSPFGDKGDSFSIRCVRK